VVGFVGVGFIDVGFVNVGFVGVGFKNDFCPFMCKNSQKTRRAPLALSSFLNATTSVAPACIASNTNLC